MAARDHAPATCAATPIEALPPSAGVSRATDVIRYGKWTLAYVPPVAAHRPWVFTHDDFDGAPDLLDPRHGCCASIADCIARITEIESREAAEDGGAFDVTTLSEEELLAISEQLVAEGLLVRTMRGTGYALTAAGRAWRKRRAQPRAA